MILAIMDNVLRALASLFPLRASDDPLDPYEHVEPLRISPVLTPVGWMNLKPIAVGIPEKDPHVKELLEEMDSYFQKTLSVPKERMHITALEVCTMRKTPGASCAIPHPSLWVNMAYTMDRYYLPIRWEYGDPLDITSGFRPEDYNRAVGGAKKSGHIGCMALDIQPAKYTLVNRVRLMIISAKIHKAHGRACKGGLKIYGTAAAPTRAHIDAGYKYRSLGQAGYYMKRT